MTTQEQADLQQMADAIEKNGEYLQQPLVWLTYEPARLQVQLSRASWVEVLRGYQKENHG